MYLRRDKCSAMDESPLSPCDKEKSTGWHSCNAKMFAEGGDRPKVIHSHVGDSFILASLYDMNRLWWFRPKHHEYAAPCDKDCMNPPPCRWIVRFTKFGTAVSPHSSHHHERGQAGVPVSSLRINRIPPPSAFHISCCSSKMIIAVLGHHQ